MKLQFFGDSWYWFWSHRDVFKSKLVKKHIFQGSAFPALEAYFQYLGIECTHNNVPGESFYQVVDNVVKSVVDTNIEYNIVFFSNLIRGDFPNHKFNIHNYDDFFKKWNIDIVILLKKLQTWADQNNQKILIIGGQSTLSREIFNSIEPKSNILLLSECISTDILKNYLNQPLKKNFGIFKLSTDFSYLVNEKWDRRLINQMYEEQEEWSNLVITNNLFGPDNVHLNSNAHLYLVDFLLAKIEKLENKNIN